MRKSRMNALHFLHRLCRRSSRRPDANRLSRRYLLRMKCGYVVLDLHDPGSDPSDRMLIYYDNDTRRSTWFERNLLRDGFKVMPWEE